MSRVSVVGLAAAVAAAALGTAVAGAASTPPASTTPQSSPLAVTPIQRVPFPDRGYVVDLPKDVALDSSAVTVTENGTTVGDIAFGPLAASGLGFGAVLAIDASDSMKGTPFAGALAAAQSFVAKRGSNESIGLVAFNGRVRVLRAPTLRSAPLKYALTHPPKLGFGTHIYDALERSLALIRTAKLSTGSIVLLSDGADFGSTVTLQRAVARARAQHVRVFTVGLRSKAYDPRTLRAIAAQTGGSYAEATSPAALAPIYASLSARLAREYLLQYRSVAAPKSQVDVQVAVAGFGSSSTSYTAPTPSGLAPFHRSFVDRFLLSTVSLLLLALIVAGLVVYAVQSSLRRTRSGVVDRVAAFAGTPERAPREWHVPARAGALSSARRARGLLGRLNRTLEIADIHMSGAGVVGLTALATLAAVVVLALITPVFAVLGLLVPLVSSGLVRRKLKQVRDEFAEQLPANLQVLASALRAGHSFAGALATVVEQAQEPSRRELRRTVADEQLGVPMDEAIRRVADRMNSRDLHQVALVAELQRTTGGNIAEVLDVTVGTIRDRQDVRRLLKTLTAQGRMARWILTGLPIATGLAFYAVQPDLAGPFYSEVAGQIALVIAAIAVTAGSLLIQRIIDVEV